MEEISEHDALVKLQIERDTSKQVGDILYDFKRDIDAHFARLEEYLEARPTNEQMENKLKACIDEKPIVYKQDFYDMWVKAREQYTEKSTGKTRNWIETAKGVGWVILVIIGIVTIMGNGLQAVLKMASGG
jgi:hypothetical protein